VENDSLRLGDNQQAGGRGSADDGRTLESALHVQNSKVSIE
jgi:hypothetical protein